MPESSIIAMIIQTVVLVGGGYAYLQTREDRAREFAAKEVRDAEDRARRERAELSLRVDKMEDVAIMVRTEINAKHERLIERLDGNTVKMINAVNDIKVVVTREAMEREALRRDMDELRRNCQAQHGRAVAGA